VQERAATAAFAPLAVDAQALWGAFALLERRRWSRVALCRAFGFEFKAATGCFRPTYVFSIPEAAWVDLTEEQLRRSGIEYEVGRSSFATNARARISGFPDGLLKLVFRVPDKSLLGVHIVGELASELVHIGQFVMHDGGTIDRFIDATFAVPTRSEAYKCAPL
jgi:NAD(P) transhydrogenase